MIEFNNIGKPWPEHVPWVSKTTFRRVAAGLTDLIFPFIGLLIAFGSFTPLNFITGIWFFCFAMTALIGEV